LPILFKNLKPNFTFLFLLPHEFLKILFLNMPIKIYMKSCNEECSIMYGLTMTEVSIKTESYISLVPYVSSNHCWVIMIIFSNCTCPYGTILCCESQNFESRVHNCIITAVWQPLCHVRSIKLAIQNYLKVNICWLCVCCSFATENHIIQTWMCPWFWFISILDISCVGKTKFNQHSFFLFSKLKKYVELLCLCSLTRVRPLKYL